MKGEIMMTRKAKMTAIFCALALAVSSFGTHMDNARAASKMVTPDDGAFSREITEKGIEKGTKAEAGIQQLLSGKRVQGKVLPGNAGQRYQITLNSSGQLDIHLENVSGKLATRLTDKNGKGWAPRRRTANGKQTYQLKKGMYYYQVQAAKGAVVPETGLDYAVTATFQFYGHLAQNAPVEYYKLKLKRISYLSFFIWITDNITDNYVVELCNKSGKILSSWETGGEKNGDETQNSDGMEDDEIDHVGWIYRYGPGLHEILPAGDYYVRVSIKKDENGKVPASAWYGRYRVNASISGLGMSFELASKQAEYTGKKIKPPKVIRKLYPKDACYKEEPYGVNDPSIRELTREYWHMTTDNWNWKFFSPPLSSERTYRIKEIGRYRIGDSGHSSFFRPDASDSYAIFTVTPIRGKINRVSSKKKGQVQVSVKKNIQSTGYQIQIARDKKFKKSIKTIKTTNVRKTIKGLSHGKKYYVRVRNYKKVKTVYCPGTEVPESIYGKWSKVRTVVCK